MSYTLEMRETIKCVEATRARRIGERFPTMSPAQRNTVLSRYHPDYIAEGMRELRVGQSKGTRTPHELADVIEGRHG